MQEGEASTSLLQLSRTSSRDVAQGLPPRATELIAELQLEPHPEGGRFRRVYVSLNAVQPLDSRPPRPALTTIYYLLTAGEHSRWHRVASDEAWHFYEGDPLELYWVAKEVLRRETLSSGSPGARPVAVVPAGCWQAARPTGSFTLVGCTVGPGFDFEDFEMAAGESTADLPRLRQLTAGLPDLF